MTTALSLTTLALFGTLGTTELVILAILGVLIFGKRLPEVGKSLGKGIVEFKKGLSGVDDDVEQAVKRNKELEDQNRRGANVPTGEKIDSTHSA